MMKYYYKTDDGNTITYLCKSDSVPEKCVEITKEQYNEFINALNSFEDKCGYITSATVYIDGTCKVEYIQEHAVHEIVEEAG